MERDRFCFCCGADNPHGLQLRIEQDRVDRPGLHRVRDDRAVSRVPGHRARGLLATLLDELMAHAALRVAGGHAATARMEVAFRRPAGTANPSRGGGRSGQDLRPPHPDTGLDCERGERLVEASALFLAVPADGTPPPGIR